MRFPECFSGGAREHSTLISLGSKRCVCWSISSIISRRFVESPTGHNEKDVLVECRSLTFISTLEAGFALDSTVSQMMYAISVSRNSGCCKRAD